MTFKLAENKKKTGLVRIWTSKTLLSLPRSWQQAFKTLGVTSVQWSAYKSIKTYRMNILGSSIEGTPWNTFITRIRYYSIQMSHALIQSIQLPLSQQRKSRNRSTSQTTEWECHLQSLFTGMMWQRTLTLQPCHFRIIWWSCIDMWQLVLDHIIEDLFRFRSLPVGTFMNSLPLFFLIS